MKKVIYYVLLILLLVACKKEESVNKGGIRIKITDEQEKPVAEANVYISPNTQQQSTDSEGIAQFKNLDAGTYQISASKSGVGNGIGVVQVIEGQISEVNMPLLSGVDFSLAPRINIIEPDTLKEYMPTEQISFETVIFDDNTLSEQISVSVESDIDGVIFSGYSNNKDSCNFSFTFSTKGVHKITYKATDSDNLTTEEYFYLKVILPIPVELTSAVKQNKQVMLNWTECTETEFQKIEILRTFEGGNGYNSEIIATIADKSVVSYTDTLPPLETSVDYQIVVTDLNNKKASSNKKNVVFPAGITFQVDLVEALLHPSNNWLYLITKSNSWSKNSVIIYDYLLDEIIMGKELTYSPGLPVLSDNGNGLELFIPGSNNVYIYSPADLSLKQVIQTRHTCMSVDANGNGILVTGESLDNWVTANPVRTYLQSSGVLIDSASIEATARVKKVPNKTNTFISIGMYVSPPEMEYYEIDNSGKFITSTKDTYHGDYELSYNSLDISPSGEFLLSYNELYKTESTLLHIGNLNHTVTGIAFNNVGNLIYTGSYSENIIRVDNYPELIVLDEITIKGFVSKLFSKENTLISLSNKPGGYNEYFVEVIHTNL